MPGKQKTENYGKDGPKMKRNKLIFLCMLILITVLAVGLFYIDALLEQREKVYISHDSGIYDESIVITVSSSVPGTIYYTVNGETFEQDAEGVLPQGAEIYEAPIKLELQEDTTLYSFQFYHLPDDGTVSGLYKRNYILDSGGNTRFSTTYVVSIVGDEEKLFGYDEGIFVRGRQFDEYIEANPEVNFLNTIVPANYLSDAEVPVNAAVFFQDGTEILSQNC